MRDFLAFRAVPGVERVDERGYARTVAARDGHFIVCLRPVEDENEIELCVRGATAGDPLQLTLAARRTFDLDADPLHIALAFERDELLAPLLQRRPGVRIPGAWDPFECAVRAVLGQQVSVAAGRTFAARIVGRIGHPINDPEEGLTHLFPSAAALREADLSGIGLTRIRITALQALAHAVMEGTLDFGAPSEEVTSALRALPGIGAWTAQYVALRGLGEADAFPIEDLVLRRMAGVSGAPLSVRALEKRAEAWRPWRGYAAVHLWREASTKK